MQLVSAERSGTLDDAFAKLAEHYDERSQRGLMRLMTVLSTLLTFGAVIYVAVGVVSGYREAVMGPLELLEREMPHLRR